MARLYTALQNTSGGGSMAGIGNLAQNFQSSFFGHKKLQRQEEQDRIALERQQKSDALAAERHAQQMELGEQTLRINQGRVEEQDMQRRSADAQRLAGVSTMEGYIKKADDLIKDPSFAGRDALQLQMEEFKNLQTQLVGAKAAGDDTRGIEEAIRLKLDEMGQVVTTGTVAAQASRDIQYIASSSELLGIGFSDEDLAKLEKASPAERNRVVERLRDTQSQQQKLTTLRGALSDRAQKWDTATLGVGGVKAQLGFMQILESPVPSQWQNPNTGQTIRIDTPQEIEDYYQFQYNEHLKQTFPEDIQKELSEGIRTQEEVTALRLEVETLRNESAALFEATTWRDMQAQTGAGATGAPVTQGTPSTPGAPVTQGQTPDDPLKAAEDFSKEPDVTTAPPSEASNIASAKTRQGKKLSQVEIEKLSNLRRKVGPGQAIHRGLAKAIPILATPQGSSWVQELNSEAESLIQELSQIAETGVAQGKGKGRGLSPRELEVREKLDQLAEDFHRQFNAYPTWWTPSEKSPAPDEVDPSTGTKAVGLPN